MVIEITEASSVITWDFDVSKGDVIFTIYHSRRAPQVPKKDTLGSHALASLGTINVQVIDKSWMLGKDYSMVERALTCNEGESVQVRDGMMDRNCLSSMFAACCIRAAQLMAVLSPVCSGLPHNTLAWLLHPAVALPQPPGGHRLQPVPGG